MTGIRTHTELHTTQPRALQAENTRRILAAPDRLQPRDGGNVRDACESLLDSATPWLRLHAAGEGQHGTYERRQAKVNVGPRSSQPTKSPTTT